MNRERYTLCKREAGWQIVRPDGEPLRMIAGEEYSFAHYWQAVSFCQTFGIAYQWEDTKHVPQR